MSENEQDREMWLQIAAGLTIMAQAIFARYPKPDAATAEPEQPQPVAAPFLGKPRMMYVEPRKPKAENGSGN